MMTLLITIDSEFVVEILFAPYAGYAALIVGIRHASLIVGTIFGRNSLAGTHYCTLRRQCWRLGHGLISADNGNEAGGKLAG